MSVSKTISKAIAFGIILIASREQVSAQNIITTIVGNGVTQYIGDGYPATSLSLADPAGMCIDSHRNILIADHSNNRIRLLDVQDSIFTVSGNGTAGYGGDGGHFVSAVYNYPSGITIDPDGNIFVADRYNHAIRRVDAGSGVISTICGGGSSGGFAGDGGPATAARIEPPRGVWADQNQRLFIADYGNHRVRLIDLTTGVMSTCAGNGSTGYSGDGGQATAAELTNPQSICTDSSGNLFIADPGSNTIRRVDRHTGIITTVAGSAAAGYSGDGGPATAAGLCFPNGVFVDRHNNIFISDAGNNVVREVYATGMIITVAGNTHYGYSGDGGLATFATFNGLTGVYVDDSDFLYIIDGGNSAIRKVTPGVSAVHNIQNPSSLSVYPNPCTGVFSLDIGGQVNDGEIIICDISGRVVYEGSIAVGKNNIDLTSNVSGMYYVKLISKNGVSTGKVVIQK